jgi:dynactin complex subunit
MSVAAPSDFLDAKGVIVQVGQPVSVNGVPGVVRFAGTLPFAQGSWVGIELDRPAGKNNGSVKGVNYFECKPQHGIFVRPKDVVGCLKVINYSYNFLCNFGLL